MASEMAPPTIQITPLTTFKTPTDSHRIVSGAFDLNPNNPACISNDSGDIISYIHRNGDAKKAIIERMDGTIIASFDLPISNGDGFKDDEGPILCWTSFQRRHGRETLHESGGERKMLCVLSNPTTLHIFDVLGDFNLDKQQSSSIGPSGHTIPLPFRARALFSLDYFGTENCHGLLILRAPSDREPVPTEVPFSPEGLSIPGTPRRYRGNDMEDELQLPPEPVRLNFQRDELIDMEEDEDVPSLFSLCDPLDEIRPIVKNDVDNKNDNANIFANVDERLIFVGSPRLFASHESHSSESAQTYTAPICVTYNSTLKRHAIWSLMKAVEPVPSLPLWKITGRGAWRTEEKEDAMQESGSIGDSEDKSQDSIIQHEEGYPSSFADIYPDFAMVLLLEEETGAPINRDSWIETKINMKTSKEDNHSVFLATDEFGTGDLILCIVMPNCGGEISVTTSILRRFSLTAEIHANGNSGVCISSVSVIDDIPCISAQQIQSIPIPLALFSSTKKGTRSSSRFHDHDVNTMSNDVLIVRKSNDKGTVSTKISLSRSGSFYIGDLVLPSNVSSGEMQLVKVENTVGARADMNFIDSAGKAITVRAFISLVVRKSPITEIAIRAVESALVSMRSDASLSLMIRSDCNALSQFIQSDGLCANIEDCCWYSLTVVLLNLFLGFEHSATSLVFQQESGSPKSAWEELLQSDFHATFSQGEGTLLFGDSKLKHSNVEPSPDIGRYIKMLSTARTDLGTQHIPVIFDSLHILHEDARVVSQSRGGLWTRRLGSLLLHVCEQYSPAMVDYEDHYRRLLCDARCQSDACDAFICNTHASVRISRFELSPCIMACLDSIIRCGAGDSDTHFDMIGYVDKNFDLNGACSASWMVLQLLQALFNDNANNDSHLVIRMLKEGIKQSSQLQEELPFGISYPLIEAIRRCRLNPPQVTELSESMSDSEVCCFYDLLGRNDLSALSTKASRASVYTDLDVTSNQDDPDKDGLVALEDYSSMVFPEDNRIREAARLLRSSRTLFLRVPRPVEQTDHEYERSKQEKLLLLCRRSIALPLGRGMITLGSYNIQSSEQLFMPNIVLAGRVPPTNGTLALDMASCPPNFRVWPEFHNGAAAGLRLPKASGKGASKNIITRTWIKYNKPSQPHDSSNNSPNTPSYAHGGFLMALGLRGYLSSLTTTDITDYLTQGTITTTVGIFLGMAANKRGSCDPSVSKMLCLHIPSLLPPSFTPMDIAAPVQAAAVAGIGLLYQGSAHRLMTEFLLNEISQPMKEQNANDKEGFALVCGLALGMVNLQKGTSTLSGLEDLRIEERLQRYIFGSSKEMDSYERKHNPRSNADDNRGEPDKDHSNDGYSINRNITAPGATLALGLMYMKSHNASISSLLEIPNTHYLLDFVRPDLLALRVIARSLILWNDVQPTREWIDAQIPETIKKSISFMRRKALEANNIDSGYDDPHKASNDDVADFDPEAVRQANAFVIAGSCFSLGLRFAGSANRLAAAAIFERAIYFLELRDNKDMVNQVQKPDTPTLVTCLCTAAISLAIVMAGTGDIDSFRLFRALRWRCEETTLYGTHQAFGAAIGLLFLGGGKCTLGSSPQDVAILIGSFFPHFPVLSADNQYHLQAIRHLYVLATYDRILESVDIDSGEKVCVPIELTASSSTEIIKVSTPYLLSNNEFSKMCTKSDRYYPIVINASTWKDELPTLFVKRKPGHLSLLQDPNSLQSLSIETEGDSFLKSISMFSNDPVLPSFAEYFCKSNRRSGDEVFEQFCNTIAHKCMTGETSDMLPFYLKLFGVMECISCESVNVQNVWDIRLMQSYTDRKRITGVDTTIDLLNPQFIDLICQRFDDLLTAKPGFASLLQQGKKWWADNEFNSDYAPLLIWFDVPKFRYVEMGH